MRARDGERWFYAWNLVEFYIASAIITIRFI